jgi:hypothetical protein
MYGGWWPSISSRFRRHITIDGYLTSELDYSSMLIGLLYAMEEAELAGDAYELPGIAALG